MNDEIIEDLKQFISTTVSGHFFEIRTDIENLDNKLSTRIDNLSQSVADAIENTNETVHQQLIEHETRITKLEQKTT